MNRRHGHARKGKRTGTYRSWDAMVQRCTNFGHVGFAAYGGAGITVCDRWLGRGGFERFVEDVGARPPRMTLERKDGRLGYFKENVRWATPREQNVNRDTGRVVRTHPETGVSKSTYEWARACGISDGAMRMRISLGEARGWPLARALTEKGHRR